MDPHNNKQSMTPQIVERVVKLAAISDTHGKLDQLIKAHENGLHGDIFIHAGDFTTYNKRAHFAEFVDVVGKLNFTHKILVPGNHEILLDPNIPAVDYKHFGIFHIHEDMTYDRQRQRLTQAGILFLDHEMIQLEGIKIFGSPYTEIPPYWYTAFQIQAGKMQQIWEGVPKSIDLLVTHGPAQGILDRTVEKKNVGSVAIRKYLQSTEARVHIFGHIHQAKGVTKLGQIQCRNVAERVHQFQLSTSSTL